MAIGDSLDNITKRMFSNMVYHQAEQIESYTRDWTDVMQITGKDFAFDRIGSVEPRKIDKRYQKVEFSDIDMDRRQLVSERFNITLPIDAKDVRNQLLNPQGAYAFECVAGMKRLYDRIVYAALDATIKVGEDFQDTLTAASDGVITVNATGGLTDAKFLEIERGYIDNEVGNGKGEPICLGLSGDEHQTALGINQIVNGDYSRQYPLDQGRITYIHGMKVLLFGDNARTPVLTSAGGVRKCFAMAKGAVLVGISKDMDIQIQERNDLIETTQVSITFDFGAVRKEGKKIQMLTVTRQH